MGPVDKFDRLLRWRSLDDVGFLACLTKVVTAERKAKVSMDLKHSLVEKVLNVFFFNRDYARECLK